jgi:hypothetical protein
VYNGTNITSKPNSIPCITLYPYNNAAGSWAFMSPLTEQRIRQSQWLKMGRTGVKKMQMDAFNAEDEQPERGIREEVTGSTLGVEEAPPLEVPANAAQLGVSEGSGEGTPKCPELVPHEKEESNNEIESDEE